MNLAQLQLTLSWLLAIIGSILSLYTLNIVFALIFWVVASILRLTLPRKYVEIIKFQDLSNTYKMLMTIYLVVLAIIFLFNQELVGGSGPIAVYFLFMIPFLWPLAKHEYDLYKSF